MGNAGALGHRKGWGRMTQLVAEGSGSGQLAPSRPSTRARKHERPTSSGTPISLSRVAWVPDRKLAPEEWANAGRRFGAVARCVQWWIGDWLRYGTSRWGEKYVEAARITGYDVGTLRNYASVAGQFDPSLRSDKLSWSHHALLAPLDDEERIHWINSAVDQRLSVADLRLELRTSQRGAKQAQADDQHQDGAPATEARNPSSVICPHCGGKVETEGEPAGGGEPAVPAVGANN